MLSTRQLFDNHSVWKYLLMAKTEYITVIRKRNSILVIVSGDPNLNPKDYVHSWNPWIWDLISVVTHLFGTSNFICTRTHPRLLFSGLGPLFLLFVLLFSRPILLNLTRGEWRLSDIDSPYFNPRSSLESLSQPLFVFLPKLFARKIF